MERFHLIGGPGTVALVTAASAAWVPIPWLKARHGGPVEGGRGQAPPVAGGPAGRIRLLTAEPAQVAAGLAAMTEHLVTLGRIATGSGAQRAREIERLKP